MKGYVIIPNSIAIDKRIDEYAVRLYLILVRRVGKNKYCWPTNEQLSIEMSCSQKTIDRKLSDLKDAGYIFTSTENKQGKTHRRIFIMRLDSTDQPPLDSTDHLNNKHINRALVSNAALSSASDKIINKL